MTRATSIKRDLTGAVLVNTVPAAVQPDNISMNIMGAGGEQPRWKAVALPSDRLVALDAHNSTARDLNTLNFTMTTCIRTNHMHIELELPRGYDILNPLKPRDMLRHLDESRCSGNPGFVLGRRMPETDGQCERMQCSGSSPAGASSSAGSSAGPSSAVAYKVQPCKGGEYKTLTVASGHVGPKPPKWPLPITTGNWFTTTFEPCTKQQSRLG